MQRRTLLNIILFGVIIVLGGCIVQFLPDINENQDFLVVQGQITDQTGSNFVKLSRSVPLGIDKVRRPLRGCQVKVSDDEGNIYNFTETDTGTYVPELQDFHGMIGRTYTLHLQTYSTFNFHSYTSLPMEMKPVPPIDSIYYKKVTIREGSESMVKQEGCQIFLDTHDPENKCKYYRWEWTETWEFRLPYNVPNSTCWIESNSNEINIKNSGLLAETRIIGFPIHFVSNSSDRLRVKYSILVNQYSITEDEYSYWEKLEKITEQTGSLYDIMQSSVASNISSNEDSGEKVLGYFSVSAVSSKRVFIKDQFSGLANYYTNDACVADTVFNGDYIPNVNTTVWIIAEAFWPVPYKVITYTRGCADCTTRGSNQRPVFWNESR